VKGRRGKRRKQLLNDLMNREGTGGRKRKHCIAVCGELALEEVNLLKPNVIYIYIYVVQQR